MPNKPVIAIIGGGFCGTATFIQLTKQSDVPLHIVLINKDNIIAKGLAFSSYNPMHVLNVPAGKMSVFPDDPENFINWVKSKKEYDKFINTGPDELNEAFLPRVIYGNYLSELLTKTIENLPENISTEIINGEAVDITPNNSGAKVILKNNESFEADKIVLALGNFIPENPKIRNRKFFNSNKYFQNPWQREAIEDLKEKESVLIIGTGLTMVDNVLSLMEKNFKGKIFAVSTKGFFPLSHKKRKPYTDILNEINPPYKISGLYEIFRKHIKHVLANGISGEAVVDAIRPKTQEIWLSLSLNDKIRFMSHIRHLWGVARHRLPKEIFEQMQELIQNGRLEIIGGRLQDLIEVNGEIKVSLKEKKTQEIRELTVHRVINCTGPKTDLEKVDDALIKNLLDKGLISPDELRLGVNALPDGTIIQKNNSLSLMLFAIGSLLKGILWESTAVPELRVQAKNLSVELVKQLSRASKIVLMINLINYIYMISNQM